MDEVGAGAVLSERYRLDSVVGRGGMATVWRATQLDLDRPVAVKLLRPEDSDDPASAARFEREARLVSRLSHPGSVKVFDFGRGPGGRAFLVMELLEGRTLADRLRQDGPLPWRQALELAEAAADALAEAHAAGVVHRDLKPGNLFLQRVGDREVLKLLDYGIARWSAASVRTTTGEVFGTPAYMSPEQAQGLEIDGRSDLYSLGAVLFECLQGAPPFQADSPLSVLFRHVQDPPPEMDDAIPEPVRAFVGALLAKSPDERPADAAIARDQAAALLSGEASAAPTPRRRTLWPLVLLAAVLALALLHLWPAPPPALPPPVVPVAAPAPSPPPPAPPAPAPSPEPPAPALKPPPKAASPPKAAPPPKPPIKTKPVPKPKGPPPGFIRVIDQPGSDTE